MKELLFSVTKKDFIIQTFRASGPGGQKVNKVETAVRIIHPESGARGESQTARTQAQNKKLAFLRLVESDEFKKWHRIKVQEILAKRTIEQIVDELMKTGNLKIEVKDKEGKWVNTNEFKDK